MDYCLDVDSLSNTTWNEVCVLSDLLHNETSYAIGQHALKICCGPDNYFTSGSCYTYCNITTPYDTLMIDLCLQDNIDDAIDVNLNFDCFPTAWELLSTTDTAAGKIATTWTYPYDTISFTATDGIFTTETEDHNGKSITASSGATVTGMAKTTSPLGSTASKTTATSITATPTLSKSASRAAPRAQLSYGTGILIALSVIAFLQ